MVYTYIVRCRDGSFYTGWTVNLRARVEAHNQGKGARYTRSRRPVQLVYWEEHPDRSQAQQREAAIKRLSHRQKQLLIEKNLKTNRK